MQCPPRPSGIGLRGFSLLEVLASLVIVSVALAALTPVLALMGYRRVQSERVEVAAQLAQGEVDKIRALLDTQNPGGTPPDGYTLADIPPDGADFDQPYADIDGPLNKPVTPNLPEVQGDSWVKLVEVTPAGSTNVPEEYIVQSFREEGSPCLDDNGDPLPEPCSFRMGVRVYHRFSFEQTPGGAPIGDLNAGDNRVASSGNTSLANTDTWLRPLTVIEAEINQGADLAQICRALADDPDTRCSAFD
ncbi:MAG: prepilin-type N-terminal cleavage/methylation domain-containing protein [Cyanobacteriota bacterium]|nr:prepilin-type N-terminal cleavage/methylation domain-containing protein [Cyanobacteriota bacterium]